MSLRNAALLCILLSGIVIGGALPADQPPVRRFEPAKAYQPDCKSNDLICNAWAGFRRSHPFPYQSIHGVALGDGSLAIVISEPPPVLSKTALDQLITTAFGTDLIKLQRLRWKLGADGWLEDLVLNIKLSSKIADPLQDDVLRDRVAFLHLALFGSAFGSFLDMDGESSASVNENAAPNLKITPRELKQWLFEPSLKWLPLDPAYAVAEQPWRDIASQRKTGTFIASDRSMVLLAFPAELLLKAQSDPGVLDPLRKDFRYFAVATDGIVGAYESANRHVALIGRRRTQSLSAVPPLRFETFKLVASHPSDELSQSYERNAVFAGRLRSGEFRSLDWAPIYLSDALIDTEFGALLNITDQLLKSWSEAGNVEYLYFPYAKPGNFPFSPQPLSRMVHETTGSNSVLYNWNTAGSAVLVANNSSKVLTARQTGALPVTYGAEAAASHDMETGKMLVQEEQAYKYFANRKDANLERVVQYTLLFQFCRAVVNSGYTSGTAEPSFESPAIRAKHESTSVLVKATAQLLDDFQSGRFQIKSALQEKVNQSLRMISATYPGLNNDQLASVMADRFSPEANSIRDQRVARLKTIEIKYNKTVDEYNTQIRQYNEGVRSRQTGIWLRRFDLDSKKLEINRIKQEYQDAAKGDPFSQARELFALLALLNKNVEEIRGQFVAKHDYEPSGSIKTPSIVVSWNSQEVMAIGGHNIEARTLRLEPTNSVANMKLEYADGRIVLKYNPLKAPLIEARASEIARAVEHQGVRDVAGLSKILGEAAPVPRVRAAALEIPASAQSMTANDFGLKIGQRIYTNKSEFLRDFSSVAEKNECCVFIVHDENQVAIVAERNLKPPPSVLVREIHDTPSMNEFLRGLSRASRTNGAKTVVFFDTPESHVQALGLNAAENPQADLTKMAEALGQRRSGETELRTDGVISRDLEGRESVLKSRTNTVESRIRSLFSRIAGRETAESWTSARVSTLDRTSAQDLVADLGWQPDRDGVPTAISLKFEPISKTGTAGGQILSPVDLSVAAGFEEPDYVAGRAQLLVAHQRNLQVSAARQASISEYAMTIRNELEAMPQIKLRRLIIVVKNGETKTVLSLYIRPKATAHESRLPV